jgi:hypothetical protein
MRVKPRRTKIQQLEFKLGSLQHELETANAELELSSSAELRQAKGESRVQTEIAALQVALEARDAEIRRLKGEEGNDAATLPEHGPGASAAHIAAAQAAAGVAPAKQEQTPPPVGQDGGGTRARGFAQRGDGAEGRSGRVCSGAGDDGGGVLADGGGVRADAVLGVHRVSADHGERVRGGVPRDAGGAQGGAPQGG